MRLLLAFIAVLLWIDFVVYDTHSIVVWIWYFADGAFDAIAWHFYSID